MKLSNKTKHQKINDLTVKWFEKAISGPYKAIKSWDLKQKKKNRKLPEKT